MHLVKLFMPVISYVAYDIHIPESYAYILLHLGYICVIGEAYVSGTYMAKTCKEDVAVCCLFDLYVH